MFNLNHKLYLLISKFLEEQQKIEKLQKLAESATFDSSVKFYGNCVNHQNDKSLIKIGENRVILGELAIFAYGGKIEIGKDCYMGEGTRIRSAKNLENSSNRICDNNADFYGMLN